MPIQGRLVARWSLILLFVGLMSLLSIVGATVWLNNNAQTSFADVISQRDSRIAAVELRNALAGAESSQRGYVMTSNEIYLAPYESAKRKALEELQKLNQALAPDRAKAPLMMRLTGVANEKIAEMDGTIRLKSDRQDQQALDLIRTNRGKALMDEINVYLSGIIIDADEKLTAAAEKQRTDITLLRLVSIIAAIIIVLVVAGTGVVVVQYTREIAASRDEVRLVNASLEQRVQSRTADLERARERAETLVSEVNHRVANSLTLLNSMVRLQTNAVTDDAAHKALTEMQARILAIGLVHRHLYTSGDVRFVALDEYLAGLLKQLSTTMEGADNPVTMRFELEPLELSTDHTVNLGVVATELVTNAWKYAYEGRPGEIRVKLTRVDGGKGRLTVEDDGLGMTPDAPAKGSGLGSRIVSSMAKTMDADVQYSARNPGTAVTLTFNLPHPQKDAA